MSVLGTTWIESFPTVTEIVAMPCAAPFYAT